MQLGTIDALLAQLCDRHGLMLLTTGNDFVHAAAHLRAAGVEVGAHSRQVKS